MLLVSMWAAAMSTAVGGASGWERIGGWQGFISQWLKHGSVGGSSDPANEADGLLGGAFGRRCRPHPHLVMAGWRPRGPVGPARVGTVGTGLAFPPPLKGFLLRCPLSELGLLLPLLAAGG